MTTHLAFAVTNKTKVIWTKAEHFSFPWQMPFLEGADSVSWQRDKESPFNGMAILAKFGGRCRKTMLGVAGNIHFLDLCLYWACLNSWNLKWTSWDILLVDGKHFTMDIIWCPKGRERVNCQHWLHKHCALHCRLWLSNCIHCCRMAIRVADLAYLPWYLCIFQSLPWYLCIFQSLPWYLCIFQSLPWYPYIFQSIPWYPCIFQKLQLWYISTSPFHSSFTRDKLEHTIWEYYLVIRTDIGLLCLICTVVFRVLFSAYLFTTDHPIETDESVDHWKCYKTIILIWNLNSARLRGTIFWQGQQVLHCQCLLW